MDTYPPKSDPATIRVLVNSLIQVDGFLCAQFGIFHVKKEAAPCGLSVRNLTPTQPGRGQAPALHQANHILAMHIYAGIKCRAAPCGLPWAGGVAAIAETNPPGDKPQPYKKLLQDSCLEVVSHGSYRAPYFSFTVCAES